jgi:single-strand DNA-binding protein
MNRVILTGRLTRDPEMRATSSAAEVARFSLACQGDFVNKTTGDREVEFVNCVAFGNLAGTIGRFCKKGSLIGITGRIKNSSYDAKDGSKRYSTDIVAEQMEFLGSRVNGNDNGNSYQPTNDVSNGPVSNVETTDVTSDPYKDFGEEITLSNDDLPF